MTPRDLDPELSLRQKTEHGTGHRTTGDRLDILVDVRELALALEEDLFPIREFCLGVFNGCLKHRHFGCDWFQFQHTRMDIRVLLDQV
ncbi:MAG TPA: hypothetical protein EYQ27_00100, partial [Gemmatimonadetes bacterium]|nr:hypothetical protein [Gemmatimonadota bacterium]